LIRCARPHRVVTSTYRRHETRDTRHETRDTRHETRDTRHEIRDTSRDSRIPNPESRIPNPGRGDRGVVWGALEASESMKPRGGRERGRRWWRRWRRRRRRRGREVVAMRARYQQREGREPRRTSSGLRAERRPWRVEPESASARVAGS
jgi:hypothetical protein